MICGCAIASFSQKINHDSSFELIRHTIFDDYENRHISSHDMSLWHELRLPTFSAIVSIVAVTYFLKTDNFIFIYFNAV